MSLATEPNRTGGEDMSLIYIQGPAAYAAASMKRPVLIVSMTVLLVWGQLAEAQESTGLSFFKNYFVTGDYVVRGVGMKGTGVNGIATATITIEQGVIPPNAHILGAFLYWQSVVKEGDPDAGHLGARFKAAGATEGHYISSADPLDPQPNLAKVLNPQGTAPCWSSGGGAGGSDGAHKAFVYRADVLRFFEQDPVTGRLMVTGDHEIQLPDSGQGNKAPSAAGASLVIIYRDPSMPLKAIVIYNGGHTMDQSTEGTTRTITGFYQASSVNPKSDLTLITANGQESFSEQVFLDGTLVATNPFVSSLGESWDNPRFDVTGKLAGDASSAVVSVTHDTTPFDCLTWGAIILGTEVQDTDLDGIPDHVETESGLTDPNGEPLPNFAAMGANPLVKDIYIEIGFMTTQGYTYSQFAKDALGLTSPDVPAHSHKPDPDALKMVADAFAMAPVMNPDGSSGIKVHLDLGPDYPAAPHIISGPGARGGTRAGEPINETACTAPWDHDGDPSTPLQPCQFPDFPGIEGWKNAYRFHRDQPLNYSSEQACVAAGSLCERRFDPNRKDFFHYGMFVHGLGMPRSTDPSSLDFHIPRNVSGIADPPGGDLVVALGLNWGGVDYNGSIFTQATTIMHELGHNLGLKHGGQPLIGLDGVPKLEPNCKPNQQSVMNYLFQMRGLVCLAGTTAPACAGKPAGTAVIDYSRGSLPALDENALSEAEPGLGTMPYPTRWYAPLSSSFIDQFVGTTPAKRRCNGSPAQPGENMVMIDGVTRTNPIDWDADGFTLALPGTVAQDVNYSGPVGDPPSALTALNAGSNDWENVDLRQVGGRRNVGSLRIDGALSLDVDWPDLGFGDSGFGDSGFGDSGFGDSGFGDSGFGDSGFGDSGFGDSGFGDSGFGDSGAPLGDIDLDTVIALGPGPSALTGIVQATGIKLTWEPPHVGNPVSYEVFRVVGDVVGPNIPIVPLGTVFPPASGSPTFVDTTVWKNTTYTYFVITNFEQQTGSRSNFLTLTFTTIKKKK
jgi:hypothetical protein